MKKIIFYLSLIFTIILISTFIYFYFRQPTSIKFFSSSKDEPKEKNFEYIIGFLPFWTIQNAYIPKEITHVAYFSINIDENGDIVEKRDGEIDIGFKKIENIKTINKKKILVIKTKKPKEVIDFLKNQNFNIAINNILKTAKQYDFEQINIDFEVPNSLLEENIHIYLNNFIKQLKQNTDMPISICVYSNSIENKNLWDIESLKNYVDFFIIMGYDFYVNTSNTAGPIAPLYGNQTLLKQKNIHIYLKKFIQTVGNDKLVLALPLYGRMWEVKDFSSFKTIPNTGRSVLLKNLSSILKDATDITYKWDEDTLSPFICFKKQKNKETKNFVLFFETPESLKYKIDLAKALNLKGIAFWALGFENNKEFWDKIFESDKQI